MKKSAFFTLGSIFTALFLLLQTESYSQRTNGWNDAPQGTNIWKGGTPGMETDWYCAKNWSKYEVPDAFSDVIIPDVSTTTQASPVIKDGRAEVNSVFLYTTSNLTIAEAAQLVVYQPEKSYSTNNIISKGKLFLLNEGSANSAQASTASIK